MTSPGADPLATLDRIWAKSPSGGSEIGERLTHHLTAVGRRMLELLHRHRVARDAIAGVRPAHAAFWAAVLHDTGKLAAPFQEMLRNATLTAGYRHEILSLLFSGGAPSQNENERAVIIGAIASHHRDADDRDIFGGAFEFVAQNVLGERLQPLSEYGGTIDRDVARALRQFLATTLPNELGPECSELGIDVGYDSEWRIPIRGQKRATLLLQELRRYRELWRDVKRNPFSELARAALLVRGLVILADRIASAGGTYIGILNVPAETELLRGHAPWSHQRFASASGNALLLRAPTGMGKTEAALLWTRNTTARTLIYVLPFQASLNAMQLRLKRQLQTDIGLLHARSLSALLQAMSDDVGGDSGKAAFQVKRARDFARLFYQNCVVSTPYQLLRAAYGIRGYPVIWAALEGAAVVLDEIHAYEAFRTGLIIEFAAHLHERWRAPVLAMSATLPLWLRSALEKRLQTKLSEPPKEELAQIRRHRLALRPGIHLTSSETIRHICSMSKSKSVLVIANTVDRAIAVYEMLVAAGISDVTLLHSRFTAEDRARIERTILGNEKERKKCAVVATQVVEVSLDIDFDSMVTEVAPLEALVQRFGRVNRRALRSPADILVLGVESHQPYDSNVLIEAAWEVMARYEGREVDESGMSALLDEAYKRSGADRTCAAELARGMEAMSRDVLGNLNPYSSPGELSESAFDNLFDGLEAIAGEHRREYKRRKLEDPRRARMLTIPLSFRQRMKFGVAWDVDLGIHVAAAHYDPVRGLLP
jgi:CRISPR-associated endonuclease/helicase Cas3